MGSRWNSWGSAAPLWVPGVLLMVFGFLLVWYAGRTVHRATR